MSELPQHAVAKVSGPSWEPLRKQFLEIGRLLLEASPDAQAELLSQYVKFTTTAAPNGPAYAVVWLKSSKRLIVGLALPEAYEAEGLGAPLPKTTYRGLTKVPCGRGRQHGAGRAGNLGRHGLPEHAFRSLRAKRGGDSCLPSKPNPYSTSTVRNGCYSVMKGEVIYPTPTTWRPRPILPRSPRQCAARRSVSGSGGRRNAPAIFRSIAR